MLKFCSYQFAKLELEVKDHFRKCHKSTNLNKKFGNILYNSFVQNFHFGSEVKGRILQLRIYIRLVIHVISFLRSDDYQL